MVPSTARANSHTSRDVRFFARAWASKKSIRRMGGLRLRRLHYNGGAVTRTSVTPHHLGGIVAQAENRIGAEFVAEAHMRW